MKAMMLGLMILLGSAAASTASAKTVTVVVCDDGGHEICRKVTYEVRPPSAPVAVQCTVVGNEGGDVPCPTKYGVPAWLRRLNEAFARAGFGPVREQPAYPGGD